MSGLTFRRLREANARRQLEWQNVDGSYKPVSIEYRGNELAGEVGELCNVVKKLARERLGMRGSRATQEQAAREMADVVVCVDLLAISLGIDLDSAVCDGFNAVSIRESLDERLEPEDEVTEFRRHEERRDEIIERAAARHGKARAATLLGISERTVYNAISRQTAKRKALLDKGVIG